MAAIDEGADELLSDFLDEAGQLLERLNENLLVLDDLVRAAAGEPVSNCSLDLLNEMFRSAHSLKGLSAMLGLSEINNLTHSVENVFDAARNRTMALTGGAVEVVFEARDCLLEMVDQLRSGGEGVEWQVTRKRLSGLLESNGVQKLQRGQQEADAFLKSLPGSAADHGSTAVPAASLALPGASASPAITSAAPVPECDPLAGVEDEPEIPAKYLSIFIDETELSLDGCIEILVSNDPGTLAKAAEDLLITAHRVKGSAASIGLHRIATLAHGMEDMLQRLREERACLTPDAADLLLKGVDALRSYVQDLKAGNEVSEAFFDTCRKLIRQCKHQAQVGLDQPNTNQASAAPQPPEGARDSQACFAQAGTPPVSPSGAKTDDLLRALSKLTPPGQHCVVGIVRLSPGPLSGLKSQLLCDKLLAAGQLALCVPAADRLAQLDEVDQFSFGLLTERSAAALNADLNVAGVASLQLSDGLTGDSLGSAPASTTEAACHPSTNQAAAAHTVAGSTAEPAGKSAEDTADAKRGPEAGKASKKAAETMRVEVERLDQLMNLAGQLAINRSRFSRVGERLSGIANVQELNRRARSCLDGVNRLSAGLKVNGTERECRQSLESVVQQNQRLTSDLEAICGELQRIAQSKLAVTDLFDAVHQLDRISSGIQRTVMDTRMVPIGPLFSRFKRVVRDITRSSGKQIQLVLEGENTELDKRMIDELGDPLIHLVRNSADHGIEPPQVRREQGKPESGTIWLSACHRGNNILVQVRDDGKGLDADRIRRKAVERGLLTPEDADKLTPHQAYQLIWEPGFSTAEKITEISGRGMGMDIVRTKIEQINGQIELTSAPGKGATFTIRLPLTLAILPCLMAEIDGDIFALPLEGVVEIARVPRRGLATVLGKQTARIRDRILPVVRLSDLLHWSIPPKQTAERSADGVTLVIIGDDQQAIGLEVDRLIGEEDMVIKSLAENFHNLEGVVGASILGDGSVSLILDVAALVGMADGSFTPADSTESTANA